MCSSRSETNRAFAVELPVWQAPNDYVRVLLKRDTLRVEFPTWTKRANYSRYKGILEFSHVWGVRVERHKKLHYYDNCEQDEFRSCYWTVPLSSWVEDLRNERSLASPDWRSYDKHEYTHYIIQSHDHYMEIVAGGVKFSKRLDR